MKGLPQFDKSLFVIFGGVSRAARLFARGICAYSRRKPTTPEVEFYGSGTVSSDRNRPTIDLRPLKFSVFECDQSLTPEAQSFIDLRTQMVRKNGWRDIPDGEQDLDDYDRLGASTVYLLLQTESGELLSGTRLTKPNTSLDQFLSVQMWGELPDAIRDNEYLNSLTEQGRTVDNNRLVVGASASPEQMIILLGAGLEATRREIVPVLTITAKVYSFLAAMGLDVTVVHRGDLGGEACVFGFISPAQVFEEARSGAKELLEWGASLAQETRELFPVPSDPISSSTTEQFS